MPFGAALVGGPVLLGGIAGSMKSRQTEGLDMDPLSQLGQDAERGLGQDYGTLRSLVDAGPGQGDVSNALSSQRDLASMLDTYSKGGYAPGSADFSLGRSVADQAFAPEQEALNQAFVTQGQMANRQAALQGRDMGSDPVLAAKLATAQANQTAMLNAQKNSMASQYAFQNPMMKLGFAQQHAQVLGNLATQALANRQALASMGSSILGNERNYQIATARHYQEQGGGLKGALTGAMYGMGMGMNMLKSANGMGMMGGGGGGAPGSPDGAMPDSASAESHYGSGFDVAPVATVPFHSAMGAPNVGPQMPMAPSFTPGVGPGPWSAAYGGYNGFGGASGSF